MARKFLYVVAALIALALAAALAYRLFGTQLMRAALVPGGEFVAQRRLAVAEYQKPQMWLARPDLAGNPALWLPPGVAAAKPGAAAVFYIHPTSFLDRST